MATAFDAEARKTSEALAAEQQQEIPSCVFPCLARCERAASVLVGLAITDNTMLSIANESEVLSAFSDSDKHVIEKQAVLVHHLLFSTVFLFLLTCAPNVVVAMSSPDPTTFPVMIKPGPRYLNVHQKKDSRTKTNKEERKRTKKGGGKKTERDKERK